MDNAYLRANFAAERLGFYKNIKSIGKRLSQLQNNRALVREIEVAQGSVNNGETAQTRITYLRENLERLFFYKVRDLTIAPVFSASTRELRLGMLESKTFAKQSKEIVLRLEFVILKQAKEFSFEFLVPRVSHLQLNQCFSANDHRHRFLLNGLVPCLLGPQIIKLA